MSLINAKRLALMLNKHSPEILIGIGIAGITAQSMMAVKSLENKADYWKLMYEITGHKIYLYRYLQMTKTNNWLRMHGYPMRKRKRH